MGCTNKALAISARNVAITTKCLKGSVQSKGGGDPPSFLPPSVSTPVASHGLTGE